jgi:hypothetical protein
MSSTIRARFATARRIRLHHEASVTYDHIRARYRAAVLAGDAARIARLEPLLVCAYDRELRRALPIFS